ncbi:MAG: dihydrolipoamide acetyltransferase family protein [Actinomycetota bacterium]
MARIKEFKLPDLGEGLTEGEILRWLVAPGDRVVINQPIVEVETAKAAVELPSPYAGVVSKLFFDPGVTVDVGQPIIAFDTEPEAGELPAEAAPGTPAVDVTDSRGSLSVTDAVPAPDPEVLAAQNEGTGRTAVLVGYGPRTVSAQRRPRKEQPAPPPVHLAIGESAERHVLVTRAKAKPPVRRMARQSGVDIDTLLGTGPDGTVTRSDVEQAAGPRHLEAVATVGSEERVAVRGVRKLIADAMVQSAFTAPHVTEWVAVDVTETMRLRDDLVKLPEFEGIKVSPLLFIAKALINAVRRTPMINSTWDEDAQEIVVKNYVNLGIAAATPRGLLVPNVKGAESLTLVQLAGSLQDLAVTARDGKTLPADMQHGTITITNVGVFGVDGGTPIINPGESAILCVGAIREMPWVHDGQVVVRRVAQLSLSFDHRVVDGEVGSRFLSDVARQLESPANLLAWS